MVSVAKITSPGGTERSTEPPIVWPNRYYDSDTGRWLTQDPLGVTPDGAWPNRFNPSQQYMDTMNIYGYVVNNPIVYIDPYGLSLAERRFENWSNEKIRDWIRNFNSKYVKYIEEAAKDNCIPKQLLTIVIANEQFDYPWYEKLGEKFVDGDYSYGLAQIKPKTAEEYKLYGEDFQYWTDYAIYMQVPGNPMTEPFIERSYERTIDLLRADKTNIQAAGRLVRKILEEMCSAYSNNTVSEKFKVNYATGCVESNFCCSYGAGKQCEKIVDMTVPNCLIQAMASVWDSGIGIINVERIEGKANQSLLHGYSAGSLYDYLYHD